MLVNSNRICMKDQIKNILVVEQPVYPINPAIFHYINNLAPFPLLAHFCITFAKAGEKIFQPLI